MVNDREAGYAWSLRLSMPLAAIMSGKAAMEERERRTRAMADQGKIGRGLYNKNGVFTQVRDSGFQFSNGSRAFDIRAAYPDRNFVTNDKCFKRLKNRRNYEIFRPINRSRL